MGEPAPMLLTFDDVAIYFSEQEWWALESWQKELYKHVMRTNYETLVSLDEGLPKPALISWIEQEEEPFGKWGEPQKPGNLTCSPADVQHESPVDGRLFGGSQQAVKSEETTCHFQLDLLQSQCSFGPFLGERDVSLGPDQGITLLNPKRHDAMQALAEVDHSSSGSVPREGVPGHRAQGLPGVQEVPSWQNTQLPCPVCGQSFWKDSSVRHQRSGCRKLSEAPEERVQPDTPPAQGQSRLPPSQSESSFCLNHSLPGRLAAHTRKGPFECSECKMCVHHEQPLLSHRLLHAAEKPSRYPQSGGSLSPGASAQAPECQHRGQGPASGAEGICGPSERKPGAGLDGEGRGPQEGDLEAPQGGHRPSSCAGCCRPDLPGSELAGPRRAGEGARGRFSSAHRGACGRSSGRRGRPPGSPRSRADPKPSGCPACAASSRPPGSPRAGRGGGAGPQAGGQCGRGFAHRGKLREHPRTHGGERPFACAECARSFRREAQPLGHAQAHGGEGLSECARSFREAPLLGHAQAHGGERPLECARSFRREAPLLGHAQAHGGERPLECARSFREAQPLGRAQAHGGERPFPCAQCGRRYRGKADLRAHQLLHAGQRPFPCGRCGKGFVKRSRLVEHIRTHTGEKPFACPECDRRFRLKAQLLSHRGLHSGERPFRCPECGKSFRERAHLLRHRRIHSPERPFACADCGKGFLYKSKLAEHARVHAKARRAPRERDGQKRLRQLLAMIEADWS